MNIDIMRRDAKKTVQTDGRLSEEKSFGPCTMQYAAGFVVPFRPIRRACDAPGGPDAPVAALSSASSTQSRRRSSKKWAMALSI
jgi:hypothetical protein